MGLEIVLDETVLAKVKRSKDVHRQSHQLFQCVELVKMGNLSKDIEKEWLV